MNSTHRRVAFLVLLATCAAALVLVLWLGRESVPSEGEEGGGPGARPSEWFVLQRAWPGTQIPHDKYLAALAQAKELRAETAILGGPGSWEPAGPDNIGGRVTALAVNPANPNVIYAGAADGGVLKTTDGGSTWTPLTDYLGSLSVGALALDPTNPQTIYLGSGEANSSGDSYAGIGLLKSTDGGANWTLMGLPDSRHIGRIVVDPVYPNIVWVAVMGELFGKNPERGVYKSTDGGVSWTRKFFVSDSTGCVDIVLDPSKPDTVYAAMWERIRHQDDRRVGGVTSAIWRTRDGGTTWTRLSSGLPTPSSTSGRIGLAICASSPLKLYAIYANHPGYFAGLYKTTNGGDSWTRTTDGALSDLYSSYGWYFGNVRVDPSDANKVYAMGLDIWRSTTGGGGWSDISGWYVHVDQHDLWINPASGNNLVAGHDGGVDKTTNGGSSWTKLYDLPISQFYAGSIDYLNPQRLYGGTQDVGTLRTLTGGVSDWEEIYGGDGFYCLVDYTDANIIYAEYQYGGLGKSTDGGYSFYDATSGIDGDDRRNWCTPVAMDPTNHLKLYYGTYRLYRTTNGASSWSAISPDLTDGPGAGGLVFGTLTTIAVAPTNPSVIYVGCDDGNVWVTQNGGTNWTSIQAGLPTRWVTRVEADPTSANIAYVTLSGYKQVDPLPHVFKTTNYGASWTDISSNLPEGPANVIRVDPAHTNTLYVGTDFGVFYTANGGASWQALGGNLPLTAVHDMALHAPTRTLVAMTHGRSMFRYALSQLTDVAAENGGRAFGVGAAPRGRLSLAAAPNPASEQTVLSFALERPAPVSLKIYDVQGRLVRDLFQGTLAAGEHRMPWDGTTGGGGRAATGTYYARLVAGEASAIREIGLVR